MNAEQFESFTFSPAGAAVFQLGPFGTAAKKLKEWALRERTKIGLDTARDAGRIGGRRPKLSREQQGEIRKMISKGEKTAADAARIFKIHPATVSRLLARTGIERAEK